MTGNHDTETLIAFLDGELDEAEAAETEARVREDPELARLAGELRRSAKLLHAAFDEPLRAPPAALRRLAEASLTENTEIRPKGGHADPTPDTVMIEWRINAREFMNCNCSYGCPCQFDAPPTHGNCKAVLGIEIDEGHFGEVSLDGLRAVGMYSWPGAIHEANGTMQLVIDERANESQRDALLKIMQGEETEPMATMWAIYTATTSTVLDPLVRPIDFEVDVDERRARLIVPDLIETSGEPIRNPVTGAPSRARIDKPEGFEFTLAEIGSGTTKTTADITLDFDSTYGQFARIHLTNSGVVRDAA